MVKNYDEMLSRFHLIPERYGRTDRQADGQICCINIARTRVSMLTRDKNRFSSRRQYNVKHSSFRLRRPTSALRVR